MIKKFIYILLGAATVATGCSLDCKPLNGPSSGTFPSSAEEAYAGTLAAYKKISSFKIQNMYFPQRFEDGCTDICGARVGAGNFVQQYNGKLTPSHSVIRSVYKQYYATVGRVHQVLDNLDKLEGKCDQATIDAFKAELLCIRAHQYDQAMQFYGGIPFIDHCLTLEDNAYGRNTIKECADRLLKDLSDATLDALPVQWNKAEYGTTRIGRIAAYMLKAKIALNWGYLDVAKSAAGKALTLNAENGNLYGLESLDTRGYISHEDGEIDVTNLYSYSGESSKEWIWAGQHSLAVGELGRSIYYEGIRCLNGCSYLGPTQSMVDTYQCTDGLSILESPLFDPANPWLNRDPRMGFTVLLPGMRAMGIQYEMDYTVAKVKNYLTGTQIANMDAYPQTSKYEYAANNTKGPACFLCRKYYDTKWNGNIVNDDTDDVNVGILRFADLLLIDAEANIEAEGGDLARARDEINQVRARVNMPPVTATDRQGLRKALRYERKVELCCEGSRWFDIRRWANDGLCYSQGKFREGAVEVACKAVNGDYYAPGYSNLTNGGKGYISNAKPVIDDNWTVTYDGKSTFDGKKFNLRTVAASKFVYQLPRDRRWPIPDQEMEANTALKSTDQNPGYNDGAFVN